MRISSVLVSPKDRKRVYFNLFKDKNEVEVETLENTAANRRTKLFTFPSTIRENSWFGKKCWKIFKLFTNTFGMTFLAEWGDR